MLRSHGYGSLVVSFVVCLLVVGAGTPLVGATTTPADLQHTAHPVASSSRVSQSDPVALSQTDTIELSQELRLTPARPGEITVRLEYAIPDDVRTVETVVPPNASVTAADGFSDAGDREYAWDGHTTTPTLTYRLSANQTFRATGPIAGDGDYLFVDRGDWALVRVPQTQTSWSWTGGGTITVDVTRETAGPGAVGEAVAYLGDHREVTRTAHGQTFRLIVPEAASLAESPDAILDSLAASSDALRVGDRDETVFVVAAPTDSVQWAIRGLATGNADMWVRDGERLDTADTVWLHEYVHTRQDYDADPAVRWFNEASASYYATLLALEQERIDFDLFRDRLALGARRPDSEAVLADATRWPTVAHYTKGALVVGELDRRVRLATDRRRTFQTVFTRMNDHDGSVSASRFESFVARAGDAATGDLAGRYTSTSAVPRPWNRTAHERAFDVLPARFTYSLPDTGTPDGYRVRGPYRNATMGDSRPIRLAVGETLVFDVRVSNSGSLAGDYAVQPVLNGDSLDRQTGTVGANATTTVTFDHQFTAAGEYTLAVGDARVAVSVRPPATPTVTGLEADQSEPHANGSRVVTVTATVANEHAIPAASNLTLVRDDVALDTRRVRLAPGERRRVQFRGTALAPGEYVFRVENASVRVTVEPPRTATSTSTTGRGPGFGASSAVFALACLLLLRRVR